MLHVVCLFLSGTSSLPEPDQLCALHALMLCTYIYVCVCVCLFTARRRAAL